MTTGTDQATRLTSRELRELAVELDSKVREIGGLMRVSTMEVGWYARIMKEKNLFAVLGYSEDAYREEIGIPESTWYRQIQIAQGFKRLDKARYMQMTSSKAYMLLDLPETERIKDYWVDRAANPHISRSDLAAEIQTKLCAGTIRKDVTSREEREWLRIRMYAEAKHRVEEILENFCRDQGLGDDRGRALELLVVDADQLGAAVVKVVSTRLPELKATVELLKNASRPAEERCSAFERVASEFIVELGKASATMR